jgi:hypothetical protein
MASMLVTPNPDPQPKGWLRTLGFTLLWIDVALMIAALVKGVFFS